MGSRRRLKNYGAGTVSSFGSICSSSPIECVAPRVVGRGVAFLLVHFQPTLLQQTKEVNYVHQYPPYPPGAHPPPSLGHHHQDCSDRRSRLLFVVNEQIESSLVSYPVILNGGLGYPSCGGRSVGAHVVLPRRRIRNPCNERLPRGPPHQTSFGRFHLICVRSAVSRSQPRRSFNKSAAPDGPCTSQCQ